MLLRPQKLVEVPSLLLVCFVSIFSVIFFKTESVRGMVQGSNTNTATTTTTTTSSNNNSIISSRECFKKIFGPPPGQFCQTTHGITHYILEGDDDDDDDSPLVILQHGVGGDVLRWDKIASDLVSKGYKVLRYDFYDRGYSESDINKYPINRVGDVHPLKFKAEIYIQQLEDVLEATGLLFKNNNNNQKSDNNSDDNNNNNNNNNNKQEMATTDNNNEQKSFIHVGHSLGGLVGIAYCAKYPDHVAGLVLMDPVCLPVKKPLLAKISNWPIIGDLLARKFGVGVFTKFSHNSVTNPNHPSVGTFLEKQARNCMDNPRFFSSIRSSNQYCQGMVGSAEEEFRRCCQSGIPIHLIWGKADKAVPYSNCCEMKRIAQEESSVLVTEESFDGMPHNVYFEDSKPVECSKSICDFVSKLSTSS